ncbi:hypothetical protein PF010_g2279 [Phytophthora fragariae]|uniref:Uncharacterized protein n=1 Tax=Phytophthora fragariae TaxID=53985 RepID=A0A6G0LXK6_9STRA|nr:hypothetical protein PF010_g2279 [Phytophthora fragariae]
MQPLTAATVSDGADTNPPNNIKKRRPAANKKTEAEPVKAEPATVTAAPILSESRSPGPYRGKCLYQSRKCENERAVKRNGKPHNLCEEHRSKQNQHQRKFDAKKFSRKRRRGSDSDDDEKHVKLQATLSEEQPAVKQLRQERTPSPMISTIRGKYPPVDARLPPIQSPHGLLRPAAVHSSSSEAYPRDRVVYSGVGQRPYLPTQVSSGYSHSELVAASIMVQPQSSSVATPRPVYCRTQSPAMTTPRILPSLLVPPSSALSPSPYHRVSGFVASSFSQVVVSTVLPPLVPIGRRRSPTPMSSPTSNSK